MLIGFSNSFSLFLWVKCSCFNVYLMNVLDLEVLVVDLRNLNVLYMVMEDVICIGIFFS